MWLHQKFSNKLSLSKSDNPTASNLGGKILVTGIGKCDEDEFLLTLLSEQKIWDCILLATDNSDQARKRFLSRTARYSGLLNVLEFATFDNSPSSLKDVVEGANCWVGFNVNRTDIISFAEKALASGIKRVLFTTELPLDRINDTLINEFESISSMFEKVGASFTGIRHGLVIDGDENNPYEIVNSSTTLMEPCVERGVLARVAAEMILLPKTANKQCGISSSNEFAAAYLNILRSTGLTRSQEVEKMFSGGLQRVAQLTSSEYDAQTKRAQEKKEKMEKLKLERERLEAEEQAKGKSNLSIKDQLGLLDEEEERFPLTEEELIAKRANEIMLTVWAELEARMVTRSTSKAEFLEFNKDQAIALATQEFQASKNKKIEKIMALRSEQEFFNKYVDSTRRQYAKLLNMERKELQNQKLISDTWVKYLFLLLETTMKFCTQEGTLFYNLDEFGQTMLLREQANMLRVKCGLQPYEVIYDPLDAVEIVSYMINQPLGLSIGLDKSAEELLVLLEERYGSLLKSVPALRGATQIIEIAVETLKKDLPPPPPTVAELRLTESQAKQEAVAQLRVLAMRNRGKPASSTAESVVGKL